MGVRFYITFYKGGNFQIKAESKELNFYNYSTQEYEYQKLDWSFIKKEKPGKLIETPDLAFMVKLDSTIVFNEEEASIL